MTRVWFALVLLMPAVSAPAADFTDRALDLRDVLAGFQEGEGWVPGTEDWDRHDPVEDPGDAEDEETGKPVGNTDRRVSLHVGAILPFLSKEAAYAGGFGFGVRGEFGLGMSFPTWIRPSLDLGFISAAEDKWEGSSTVILAHGDAGYRFLDDGLTRASAFLCLGLGLEMFSGTEKTPSGEEDVSEFNANLLAGLGGMFGLVLTPQVRVDIEARFTFPLGSRNVQGLIFLGFSGSYTF
ncbi:MAG: hypothetical protein ACYS47_12290 [Planctomycetota bacterium]